MIHPNNDVKKSPSSNDTISAAMHIAAYKLLPNVISSKHFEESVKPGDMIGETKANPSL